MIKIPDKNNLKKKNILAHGFRGFSTWLAGSNHAFSMVLCPLLLGQ
jgi:hypothetical protein